MTEIDVLCCVWSWLVGVASLECGPFECLTYWQFDQSVYVTFLRLSDCVLVW